MAVLLETNVGDLVVDLDVEGSPRLCENFLKLCQARYYTNTLIYNVTTRFFQAGDPTGTGQGGGCIYGVMGGENDITKSPKRFIKSQGRRLTLPECREKGRMVATELHGVEDTVGSQFLITLEDGEGRALDGYRNNNESASPPKFLSLGSVSEDNDGALDKIAAAYCDSDGRPYADIRILRAFVVHDPFDDPPGLHKLLESRGVETESDQVVRSPSPVRPAEEKVAKRISVTEVEDEDEQDEERLREREELALKQQDKGRAVVLEMLGDLPDAEIKAPENVLFICKLNPVTVDEDLELIFSRFDEKVKVEIIRDQASGKSLQYAFAEFCTKKQAVEAYFKMNNALIDDRRVKVDFSQSVAKVWDKYNQKLRMPKANAGGAFGQSETRRDQHHLKGGGRSRDERRYGDSRHRGPQRSELREERSGEQRDRSRASYRRRHSQVNGAQAQEDRDRRRFQSRDQGGHDDGRELSHRDKHNGSYRRRRARHDDGSMDSPKHGRKSRHHRASGNGDCYESIERHDRQDDRTKREGRRESGTHHRNREGRRSSEDETRQRKKSRDHRDTERDRDIDRRRRTSTKSYDDEDRRSRKKRRRSRS